MSELGDVPGWKTVIVDAYMQDQAVLRQATIDTVIRLSRAATNLADEALVAELVEVVMGAQLEAGAYGVEYVSTMALDDDIVVDSAKYVGKATRGDTLLETVYQRPAKVEAEALEAGLDAADARAKAERELAKLADTDVAVATRTAETEAMTASSNVIGYNRSPEANACEFCWLIADRHYNTDALAPAHNFCRCGTVPILADEAADLSATARVELGIGTDEDRAIRDAELVPF
ncbi:MAG: hypothetical protein ACF8PN_04965 [Phycisphaerales bacterium]